MSAPKWILLAEDNANDADLAMRALKANHLEVEVVIARDGLEALDCLFGRAGFADRPAGQPALVLLDLKMPKVDGLDVLRAIKTNFRLKVIPVVMFTSSREQSDVAVCYQTGANAYVVKPLNFRELAIALKNVGTFWMMLNELPPPDAFAGEPVFTRTATHLAGATEGH